MKELWVIGFCLCLCASAQAHNDSIYLGTQIKLDIASPIIVPAATNWGIQNYEIAVNARIAKRFYPTFELGYAGGKLLKDTVSYKGHGGFFRVGCDLHPLKRHRELPHALLIGVRLGTAVQDFDQVSDLPTKTDANLSCETARQKEVAGVRADCWGEIVAGCQVEIAKGENNMAFYMGWMGRFKCLFTRNGEPIYIPGFGKNDIIGWGVNYYLGWKF